MATGSIGSNHHRTTIVLEFGSSRVRVGFAGESKPRRVLDASYLSGGGGGSSIDGVGGAVNDDCGGDCLNYFRYFHSPSSPSGLRLKSLPTSERDWERALHPLVTRILTSILFLNVHSARKHHRPRILVLGPDPLFVPRSFRNALSRVLLEYHKVGGVLFVNGGAMGTVPYLLDALLPTTSGRGSSERSGGEVYLGGRSRVPRACLIVDIGTEEARCAVAIHPATLDLLSTGASAGIGLGQNFLSETVNIIPAGHRTFVRAVMDAYRDYYRKLREDKNFTKEEESGETSSSIEEETKAEKGRVDDSDDPWLNVATLEDGRAIIRAWIIQNHANDEGLAQRNEQDETEATDTIRVCLPCTSGSDNEKTIPTTLLPAAPINRTFHDFYLDYTHSQSLVYALLSSSLECPLDLRKAALHNVLLVGGGSAALLGLGNFGGTNTDLCGRLENAVRLACGCETTVSNGDGAASGDGEEGKRSGDGRDEDKEKKEDVTVPRPSSIVERRFHRLRGAVRAEAGRVGGGEGIRVRNPAPFSPDDATWVGGSVAGSLALEHERWLLSVPPAASGGNDFSY